MTGRMPSMQAGSQAARLVGFALVLTWLAACGGSSAGTSPVPTNSVDLPPSYKFVPADIAVSAGTTVTWTNSDHFTHSVQFTDGGLPNDPLLMDPGRTATFVFKTPGSFHYQCSLHPQNMKGSVVVSP